jgi:anti-sigma B factor antagonist
VVDTPKSISVGRVDDRICIRVVGRGTFQNSQPLRDFARPMIERGQHEFVIDLGQCQGLDSTFLGVLAGIGLRLREAGHGATTRVIHADARQAELLQTLGLDRLFDIQAGGEPLPENGGFHSLPDTEAGPCAHPLTRDEAAELILEAHKNLICADRRNAPRFNQLIQSLRESIRRRRTRRRTKP